MIEKEDLRGKWGNFNITDEQAERINNGDIDEFNLFFFNNYNYIQKRCKMLLLKKGKISDFVCAVNSVYLDLRMLKLKSASQLECDISRSCSYYNYGGYYLTRHDSPQFINNIKLLNIDDGFSLDCQRDEEDDKTEYYIIDREGETCPSPFEEMEIEAELKKANNVAKICEILSQFLSPKENEILPYYLNGQSSSIIAEALKMTSPKVLRYFQKIRDKLIINYKAVLEALLSNGYGTDRLINVIPENYNEVIRRSEVIRQSKLVSSRRWKERRRSQLSTDTS